MSLYVYYRTDLQYAVKYKLARSNSTLGAGNETHPTF